MMMNSIILVKTFIDVASMHERLQCLTMDVHNAEGAIQECTTGFIAMKPFFLLSTFEIYLRTTTTHKKIYLPTYLQLILTFVVYYEVEL